MKIIFVLLFSAFILIGCNSTNDKAMQDGGITVDNHDYMPVMLTADSGFVYRRFTINIDSIQQEIIIPSPDSISYIEVKRIEQPYLDSISLILSENDKMKYLLKTCNPSRYFVLYIDGQKKQYVINSVYSVLEISKRPYKGYNIKDTKHEDFLSLFIDKHYK